MFTPKWKKEAKLLHKGARKFVNYKRDLMEPEKIEAIENCREELIQAVKAGDREKTAEADKALTKACEGALPRYKRPNAIEENIEVFFVAIVIALGIRAYYLQPFRIPTGSMQPTLNGIIGEQIKKEDFPSMPVKAVEFVLRGSKYMHKELDRDRTLVSTDPARFLEERNRLWFTYTKVHFTDGSMTIHAPRAVLTRQLGFMSSLAFNNNGQLKSPVVPKGTVLVSGRVSSGDLVLVDKVSYNFRNPKRGEVWVFDTRGIEGIHRRSGPQGAGSHYIKRLAGVPGDTLQIKPPKLLVNGADPEEQMLLDVMNMSGPFSNPEGVPPMKWENVGYVLAHSGRPGDGEFSRKRYLDDESDTVTLEKDVPYGFRQYFSLGDNTDNSLDSRYWGPVNEYNVVGPALFSLWPITTGHWGLIR